MLRLNNIPHAYGFNQIRFISSLLSYLLSVFDVSLLKPQINFKPFESEFDLNSTSKF
jgi:hypothetical protein